MTTGTERQGSTDVITVEDVLGAMVWRLRNVNQTPPRILCLSVEARERNRELAREIVEGVRNDERLAAEMRDAGNPRAFFMNEVRRG